MFRALVEIPLLPPPFSSSIFSSILALTGSSYIPSSSRLVTLFEQHWSKSIFTPITTLHPRGERIGNVQTKRISFLCFLCFMKNALRANQRKANQKHQKNQKRKQPKRKQNQTCDPSPPSFTTTSSLSSFSSPSTSSPRG